MAKTRNDGTGDQWTQSGIKYTVNNADDPKADGGYYLSMEDSSTGDHSTAVYDSNDNLVNSEDFKP